MTLQQIVESRCTCMHAVQLQDIGWLQAIHADPVSVMVALQTYALRECMLKHREYYAPVLEEEVSCTITASCRLHTREGPCTVVHL